MVKKVISDEKKEESAESADNTSKKIKQREMPGPRAKTMNTQAHENPARGHHDAYVALCAQNPEPAIRRRLFEGNHRSREASAKRHCDASCKRAAYAGRKRALMTPKKLAHPITTHAAHILKDLYLPRICACLEELSLANVWWRPNEASNSVGNLVLHLEGNVRQWIISGLAGRADNRQRDVEFSTRRRLHQRTLEETLQKTVRKAYHILPRLSADGLARVHVIQNFNVTGWEAVFHVAEHFAHHTGQIILLTKMMTAKDLKFTHLGGGSKKKTGELPAW